MAEKMENRIGELLDAAKAAGADGANAVLASSRGTAVSVRLGKVQSSESAEESDASLRVFVGRRNASVSTTRLDADNIRTLAERAVAMARHAPEDPYKRLAHKDEIATSIPDIEINDPETPGVDRLRERALEAEDAARAVKGITNSEGGEAGHSSASVHIAATNGFAASYSTSSHGLSVSVIAGEGSSMERDHDYSAAVFGKDMEPAAKIGKRAGERTIARLGPTRPKTGQFPVVYDRRVSGSIVGTIAGAIHGNAIARGTSFLKDSMDQRITREGISLIDDPLRPRGLGSRLFDAEGLPVERCAMVENGILKSWFLDISSATKLGLAPNGKASGPSNFYLENGKVGVDELIADISEGFLVTEMMGSSVDMITGDYSRGAAGFWIIDGKAAHPVSEATIAGNLKQMFMAMTPANDIDMRRTIAAPTLRIDSMTVAGS